MDIQTQLAMSTIKILCDDNSSGTGFFFNFNINEERHVPTIITNRHVLEKTKSIKLIFSLNNYFDSPEKDVEKREIDYNNIQQQIVYHSDPEIDLCALRILPIIQHQLDNKIKFQTAYLDMSHIPGDDVLENLRFLEDIVMVGYPSGLSDVKNNFPIFRRGSTATHPGVDFEGKPECMIDMTVTPGSSGSPVFIYNSNGFTDKNGNTQLGAERLIFLGVNKAVYFRNEEGEIIEIPAPTKSVPFHKIGINLGLIIKSKVIKDIEEQIIEGLRKIKIK